MPIAWKINGGIAWLQTTDPWTIDEWISAAEAFMAHPDFRPGTGIINDRRKARAPTTSEVKATISFIQRRGSVVGPARWAAVTSDSANYGMTRMAQFLVEGMSITLGVFRDPADAEAWVRGAEGSIGKRHARD